MNIYRLGIRFLTSGFFLLSLIMMTVKMSNATQPIPQPKPTSLVALKNNISSQQSEISSLTLEGKQLQKNIGQLKNKLLLTSKKIRLQEQNLKSSQETLFKLETQKKHLKISLIQGQKDLTALLTSYQRIRRTPKSALLSDKINPIDIARSEAIFAHTLPYLKTKITTTSSNLNEIRELERQISTALKKNTKSVKTLSKAETELSKIILKKNHVYKQTSTKLVSQQKNVQILAAQANDLEELIFKVTPKPIRKASRLNTTNKPTLKLRKTLSRQKSLLPVIGKISTRFGAHDALGAQSQGITFDTRVGANVYTPISGIVQFSGPFQNFKHLLIIEHEGGYHSLISGLDVINTRVGSKLSAGEIIGKFGSSTSSPKLYYELRQNGKPINPETVLNAKN